MLFNPGNIMLNQPSETPAVGPSLASADGMNLETGRELGEAGTQRRLLSDRASDSLAAQR